MGKFGFGQSIKRKEDSRFLTGQGRYTDDINLPGQAHLYVVRSPHAHASFTIKDTAKAAKMPGVAGVLIGADALKDGLGDIPCKAPVTNRDGSMSYSPPYPVLASDAVRHVGDAVAVVVAESLAQARDAAELIDIDWQEQPAVADTAGALAPGAASVWPQAKNNLVFDWELGNEKAADSAFKKAHHVSRIELVNNRVVVNSMEPRGAIGAYDATTGQYTLYTSSQGSHTVQGLLGESVLKVKPATIRVVTPDVGGGFGMKLFLYREHALVTWAAKRFGRPIKWTCERADAFLSDTQGRDHVSKAELALDKDGKFLALKVSTIANLGAYLSNYGPFIPTLAGTGMLAGLYSTPAIHAHIRGVFTHTVPVDAYRGAGRPEAAYLVERLVDLAARELGLSPAEIRRRNFIQPSAMPFTTALGETYDSGEFAAAMEKCMQRADWEGAAKRKADSERKGKLRGIGMATYVEACGGGGPESAWIEVDPAGTIIVRIGTQSNGQGHETAYAQLVADGLGVDIDKVRVIQGDTQTVESGSGTGGSRSLPVGGVSLSGAVTKVIEKGKKIAAHVLEAAESDIVFDDGRFVISGTDRSMSVFEAAAAAKDAKKRPPGMDPGLDAANTFTPPASTYPNGCHIAEVEVDPLTGIVSVDRYTIVDDFGTVLNPMLVQGQVHGGIAQGLGQALLEGCTYDAESGQLLTGSFMDYCMPRATNIPPISFDMHPVKCRTNPLGLKGCGEAGAIGAPPTVINALIDALQPHGVKHIDMPATPQKVWAAINGGLKQAAE
ncbi:MAG: xanthine dehydrogenase family protein molybdopterin-binding subunit [Proteobacteria bacterium]|nr:xanthine dehydrogenase family protein molybdopterin-binding subunit [Pseudomonadota bacterium]MBI3499138.1 xanthine dehydrogenase family protein molybdopterin-binding subunit [Pseudomonadota bacterium]